MILIEPYGFIYITTNLVNGKRYIGKRRFSGTWQRYLGSGKRLKQAIKKYGRINFSRSIIDIGYSEDELNEKEKKFIMMFDADKSRDYYNISEGGELKGQSGENAYSYGKHIPQSAIDKANQKRNKKVCQFDLNSNCIGEYASCTIAAKENKVSKQGISKSCNDKTKTCGGSFWSYNSSIIREYDVTKNHKEKYIVQIDKHTHEIINNHMSAREASALTGISKNCIYLCCSGKCKTGGGYIWKYKEDMKI